MTRRDVRKLAKKGVEEGIRKDLGASPRKQAMESALYAIEGRWSGKTDVVGGQI